MKLILLTVLLGSILAMTLTSTQPKADYFEVPEGFPTDLEHRARCIISWTFDDQHCSTLEKIALDHVLEYTPGPANGLYVLINSDFEESNGYDYLWSTRETPVAHYTDDVLLTFTQNKAGCAVNGFSRSQGPSEYDFATNYCNMRNLFKGEHLKDMQHQVVHDCDYLPSESDEATCSIY